MSKKKGFVLTYNAIIERIDNNTGKVIDREKIHNLVVDDGLQRVAELLGGLSSANFDTIAIGEGAVSPANGDTVLGNEAERQVATVTYPTSSQVRFAKVFTFGSGVTYSITEAGIFDSVTPSGSTMFNRLTFSTKSVDSDTDLSITITITIARV